MPKKVRQMQSMLRKMRPAIMLRAGNVVASSSHHCAAPSCTASCAGMHCPGGLLGSFLSSRAGINDKTCSRLVRAILSKSVKLPKLGVAR